MFRNSVACTTSFSAARASLKQAVRPARQVCQMSTSSAKSESNAGLYFSLAGLAGIGAWAAMGGFNGDIRSKIQQINADEGDALSSDEFRPFKLKEVRPYNHDSSVYIFELPDNKKSGVFTASAIVVRGAGDEPKDKDGNPVIRPYTPINKPEEKGQMELLIKHYAEGNMTQHLKGLKVGDEIRMKGPIPKHKYKANEFEHIGLVAGGSGITPMWQLMQTISSDSQDKTKVTLLFANKTEGDILLRDQLEALKKDSRFNVVYFLDNKPSGFDGEEGFVTKEAVEKYLPKPSEGKKAKIFVCGPPPMYKALCGPKGEKGAQGELSGALKELGFTQEQVFKF